MRKGGILYNQNSPSTPLRPAKAGTTNRAPGRWYNSLRFPDAMTQLLDPPLGPFDRRQAGRASRWYDALIDGIAAQNERQELDPTFSLLELPLSLHHAALVMDLLR